jgi:hypothetical protein
MAKIAVPITSRRAAVMWCQATPSPRPDRACTVVQRAARNRACDQAGVLQRPKIVERGHAARGDHRDVDGFGQRGGGGHIGPGQHPIPLDIGMDDRGDPGIGEILRQFGGRHRNFRLPSPVSRPDPRGHRARPPPGPGTRAPPPARNPAPPPLPCPESPGPHRARSSLRPLPCRAARRRAGPGWTPPTGSPRPPGVDRPACKRAVQIDQMQPVAARRLKRSACPAGSVLNTVAASISPRNSRTQAPSFRSMAG